MDEDGISVVSIPNMSSREECEDNRKANAIDSKEKYVSYWNICYVFAVLACCTVFSSTVTLMPRSNSIFYQTHWFEFNLTYGLVSLLLAGSVQLSMIVWFRSKTLQSFWIFLRIYAFELMLWILPYSMAYVIWCIYFGYNWPIPYLGYNYLIGSLVYPIGIWFIFPKSLRVDAEFQKNMKLFSLNWAVEVLMLFLREAISMLFKAIPPYLQWIVPLLIPILKYCDTWATSNLINRMTGGKDEASKVLLAIRINATYSNFVAARIFGAETITVCFFVLVEFILQLQMTYKIVQTHNKIFNEEFDDRAGQKPKLVKKLALAEITEGVTPMVFAIGFAMAYYGPNSTILGNVKNEYWGYKKVDDVGYLYRMMLLLFGVDTLSVIVNSLILRELTDIDLLQEFCRIMKKYWFFIAVRFANSMCTQYATKDINLGLDSTGEFEWITKEGRLQFISNATELSEEEKAKLLLE